MQNVNCLTRVKSYITNLYAKLNSNPKMFNLVNVIIIALVSLCLLIPLLATGGNFSGHDCAYHIDCIKSLNEAWREGIFGERIYALIGQDYGYGTGFFYSMIPAGVCVIFMNVFGFSLTFSLFLEFFLIVFFGSWVVYKLLTNIFSSKICALIGSVFYVINPYFITDIYIRFAFSEIFLILAVPLIFYGIYQLIEKDNYKQFLLFFTIGTSLGICTHLSTTIYVMLFVALYILLRIKKFIKSYNWVPFLVSCGLIVLISCAFWLPMLVNYGVVDMSEMARDGKVLYGTVLNVFTEDFLIMSTVLCLCVYLFFLFTYFTKEKEQRNKNEKILLILSTVSVFVLTPLCPWVLAFGPFCMIQFAWRLFIINMFMNCVMLCYIIKNFKLKWLITCFVVCCFLITNIVMCSIINFGSLNNAHDNERDICLLSDMSEFSGMGSGKHGDYFPKGASKEYLHERTEDFVLKNTTYVDELAWYQTINQLSFVINSNGSDSIVLDVPYYTDLKIYQFENDNPYNDYILSPEYEDIDGTDYLKIHTQDSHCLNKIIITYEDGSNIQNYLQTHPFEIKVKSGNATATDFIKQTTSSYSVSFDVSDNARIELPTFYYKGYKLEYTNSSGESYEITSEHGEKGLIEISLTESGTLSVYFEGSFVTVAWVITILGIIFLIICLVLVFVLKKEFFANLKNKFEDFMQKHKTFSEICRFILIGGIATIIDFVVMGVVEYAIETDKYQSILNIFINSPQLSTFTVIFGNAIGFIVSVVFNYILSILFVFHEKGESKTIKGFTMFVVLNVIGLIINMIGMYIGYDLLNMNQWVAKILITLIVLVYNYLTRKFLIFKDSDKKIENKQK